MDSLQVFNYQNKEVRTELINGEPWFVAKDVCLILDIFNTSDALTRIDNDEKGIVSIDTLGGKQDLQIINESGMYSLVLGSRKPEAKQFKKWLTQEVIPSIRKHGAYMTPATLEQALTDPDFIIKLAMQLKAEQAKIKALEPKAEYFDKIVERNLLINLTVAAKELGVKRNALIGYMLDNKFLYRDSKENLIPYAMYCPELFEIKEWANDKASGVQTLLTPKGRETFRLLLKKEIQMGGVILYANN